jgi:hypothetical protein
VETREKSQRVFSKHSESQLAEAKENLVRCLDGLDNGGRGAFRKLWTGSIRKPTTER